MTTSEIEPEKKTIKVKLSERRPVTLDPEQWPIIAKATWFDGQHRSQANHEAYVLVRQHEDGRTLVYSKLFAGGGGVFVGFRELAGGFLLPARGSSNEREYADEIVRAIRRCAGIIDMPELGDECISDLPAEEI
jgi:hypothetical protein